MKHPARGAHGWYVIGGMPWSYFEHFADPDEPGRVKMSCHLTGSDWSFYGPFKTSHRAWEWVRSQTKDRIMRFSLEPWYVVKRYVRFGSPAFSRGEVERFENDCVEWTEHIRMLRYPRVSRRPKDFFVVDGNVRPKEWVTERTRLPKADGKRHKMVARIVRPKKTRR